MKKLAMLLALLLLVSCLTACGEDGSQSVSNGAAVEEESFAPTESIPVPGEFESAYDADHCSQDQHSYVTEVLSEVGCETYGEVQHTCVHCGWYYFELVKATGHDYNPPTCEFDAYCTICHMIVETATGHTTDNGICDNCGAYIQPGEPSLEQPATEEQPTTETQPSA